MCLLSQLFFKLTVTFCSFWINRSTCPPCSWPTLVQKSTRFLLLLLRHRHFTR